MLKRNFVYQGKVHGDETLIYYIEDEKTGRKHYYVLERLPDKYQNNPRLIDRVAENAKEYNEKKHKKVEVVSLADKLGNKTWYVKEPSLVVTAYLRALQIEREIKKEQKKVDELNKTQTQNGAVTSSKQYKKPRKLNRIKIRLISLGLTSLILIGSVAGITKPTYNENKENNAQVVETSQEETIDKYSNWKQEETFSQSEKPTDSIQIEENIFPEKKVYIDYDSLSYRTYLNSNGETFLELADALMIADVCYNNIVQELESYNEKASDKQDYSFNPEKFESAMFTGEQIRESSLKLFAGDDITKADDYEDKCRGPFKIGPEAIVEANEVSMKLTGEQVIRNEEDLYDVVRACRACMYIAIKNYEYCAGIIGDEVEPNMVFDTYLYGCGNVMSWLKNYLENGEYNGGYQPKTYSKDIMYFSECLEPYLDKLLSGETDGSHDKYWQDTYYNGLWKKPDWSKINPSENTGSELGD